MNWHWCLSFLAGLAGGMGLIACTLDQSGTSIFPDGASESSGTGGGGGSAATSGSQGSAQGAGGAGSGSGAGGGGSSSTTTTGQGGSPACGMSPPSTPTVIVCDMQDECQAPINCPTGADCIIQCTGQASCKATIISCPQGHLCRVVCNAPDSCQDTMINCGGGGVCELVCGNQAQACTNTRLVCSAQKCTATCSGGTMPDVQCNTSCMCTACM